MDPKSKHENQHNEKKHEIWDEYYPILQSMDPYDRFGSSGHFISGTYSSQVVGAYKDAAGAFLITLFSMVVISIVGLIFSEYWGLHRDGYVILISQSIWLISPICAAVSMRIVAKARLEEYHCSARWNIRPMFRLFKLYNMATSMRLFLLGYAIPLTCGLVSYVLAVALHVINPVDADFVQRVAKKFAGSHSFDDSIIFYALYTLLLGIFWDVAPPSRFDFGIALGRQSVGCSWFLLSIIQEIGWSGSLYPVLDLVCAHSTLLSTTLTGVVWALWHWPYIIAEHFQMIPKDTGYFIGSYESSDGSYSILYSLAAFSITLVGSRVIMCWIQGRDSYMIWTSVVYHGAHNLFIVSVFAQIVEPSVGHKSLVNVFSGESSICLVVAVWFSALILSRVCCAPRLATTIVRRK